MWEPTCVTSLPAGIKQLVEIHLENILDNNHGVIRKTLGDTIPQGSLFAYLWRRFGPPNRPNDPYKELASYLLTTPHPSMWLSISPYSGGDTLISLRFLTDWETSKTLHAYRTKPFTDWFDAFYTHLLKNPPTWWDAWCTAVPEKDHFLLQDKTPKAYMRLLDMNANRPNTTSPECAWILEQKASWIKTNPKPTDRDTNDWTTWDKDDPHLPFIKAAEKTLKDLLRPVYVRDCPIDIFGPVDENHQSVKNAADYYTP